MPVCVGGLTIDCGRELVSARCSLRSREREEEGVVVVEEENGTGGGIGEVGGVNWGAGRRAVEMEVILLWFAADTGSSVRRKSQNT